MILETRKFYEIIYRYTIGLKRLKMYIGNPVLGGSAHKNLNSCWSPATRMVIKG